MVSESLNENSPGQISKDYETENDLSHSKMIHNMEQW